MKRFNEPVDSNSISAQNQSEYCLKMISDAVVNMDEENIITHIKTALNLGVSATEIYDQGLSLGMLIASNYFAEKKYFVSEVIVCADTLNKGIQFLNRIAPVASAKSQKIVIAVVEGDLHEIGKNILKILLEAAGFHVVDLGLNVKVEEIVQRALAEHADIIGLSTMMTTTMGKMKEVIDLLNSLQQQNIPKVIIGGGCISERYAQEIGADGYSPNAVEAVKLVYELTGGRASER